MEIRIADKDTLDKVAIAVGASDNKIYGIRINKKDSNPNTRCEYLGDAVGMKPAKMNFNTGIFEYGDWADVWFVKDNFPCILKPNGSIAYKLNPNDYSLKEDGTASDISNITYDGNAMSALPTVWIWQYELGDFKYIWLANYKVNDNYKAYAHQRPDGSIAPYVFMSIYKGSLENADSTIDKEIGTKLFSFSGQPTVWGKYTSTEEDQFISNWLDTSIWRKKTWFQRNLIQCLTIMIICSTDASSKLGKGLKNSYSGMTTGTLDNKGQFYGYNDADHQVKVFHQENVWGGAWDRLDGFIFKDGNIILEDKYSIVMPRLYNTKGYFHNTFMTEFGDFPTDVDGSATTYECAQVLLGTITSYVKIPIVGGATADSNNSLGNLYNYCDNTSSGYTTLASASLSCLP